jgi:hypothetical protein
MRIDRLSVRGNDHVHVHEGVHVHVHVNDHEGVHVHAHVHDHDHVNVNVNVNVNGCDIGGGCDIAAGLRVNVNAHSSDAGCGTERDELHGRVDHASAGRGDGTALHRDTAVNGRAMGRSPAERERVLAFSSSLRTARPITPPPQEAR